MSEHNIKEENGKNIKNGVLEETRSDEDSIADAPFTRTRPLRKSIIVAIAAVALLLSTVALSIAVGFDPMSAWQSLFGRETAIEIDENVTPAEIHTSYQSLYTDALSIAVGFDPMGAWQSLFGRDTAIEIGEIVTSAGIRMNFQSLYTDGNHAVLRITMKDLEGDRLSGDIKLASMFPHRHWMYIVDSHYESETGELTCIVFLVIYEIYDDAEVGDTFTYTINSILVNSGFSSSYNSLDFDLYEATINSNLQQLVSDDEWVTSARENPVDTIYFPEYSRSRIGVYEDSQGLDIFPQKWLPLDTSVSGVQLIHWLSVLGTGYDNGYFHIQLRYDDMLGTIWQYNFGNLFLIDNEGNIVRTATEESDGLFFPGEIQYAGYHELRFYVGDIENLRDYRLAWTGTYAEHTITGDWTVDVDLAATDIDSISDSIELSDHNYLTEASFTLSPLYMETDVLTMIEFPDKETWDSFDEDSSALRIILDRRDRLNVIHATQEIVILLNDGTEIVLDKVGPFDYMHFPMREAGEPLDPITGNTRIITRHILDGSFDVEDVAEVIIYGISFRLG